MICHRLKCIFIHIPRTAGSSIEKWICGDDWWNIEPQTKHLIASVAKDIYKEYWDSYFKFSFVRDPVERVVSCLKHKEHFGISISDSNDLDFSVYNEMFGPGVILEFDRRFYKRENIIRQKHITHAVYSNILDEPMDFIGKYENLKCDLFYLGKVLGLDEEFSCRLEASEAKIAKNSLSLTSLRTIYSLYECDYERFEYKIPTLI
ncbi:sulfotransferase family 2 domain-containing protein [Methylobacterium nodulans]|uniref:sulfotransferase family 2 domain-containing protein n=1 Tax=Methylobacterium nodulans TaxID=114616 RepID=UPI00016197EB